MPEGDTILRAANRIRPVLEGAVPDEIAAPQPRHARDRWPERLAGRHVERVETHGKHLFLRFEGDLVLHSHLRMTGAWAVHRHGAHWRRSPRRAWLVLRARGHEVVEFDGPVLELMTASRTRFDQRLAALGPDVLAPAFDADLFLRRLRENDPTRPIGDALLDQRIVAGIGNIWKAEGCWGAQVDPWRRVEDVSDAEALAVIDDVRPRMLRAAEEPRTSKNLFRDEVESDGAGSWMPGAARDVKAQRCCVEHRGWRSGAARRRQPAGAHLDTGSERDRHVYKRAGLPCPRCEAAIGARGQGDDNRTTYWCPGCQR